MFKVEKHEDGKFTIYRRALRGSRKREYIAIKADRAEAKRLLKEYKEQVKAERQ